MGETIKTKKFFSITAFQLRVIAVVAMFIDHFGKVFFPNELWMSCIGRLAFPIFAFQIVEGFFYTSDFIKYCKRLFIFAIISEIPYNLMIDFNSPINPFHQNVIWTLVIGLICIKQIDGVIETEKNEMVKYVKVSLIVLIAYFIAMFFRVDYYGGGVLTIVVFYLGRKMECGRFVELVGLILINFFILDGRKMIFNTNEGTIYISIQLFAILSIIPIWMHKGMKGHYRQKWNRFCYWFYPVHMLILAIIANIKM